MDWTIQLGTWIDGTGIFESAATFITSWPGITAACLAIVLWALGAYWLGFKRRIRPLIRHLKAANAELQKIEDEPGLAASFHDFDETIAANPLLGVAWREFAETLLFPGSDDEPVIRNAQNPAHYFRRDALLGRKLNLRLYNAIPNLLTGAGILGTFIGLVAGIYLASDNLASDSIELAKQAMQQLLHGASLAFITSIFGLVSSLLFSMREKHWVHRFDEGLGRWVSGLERRMRRVTPEQFAQQQLRQLEQQTDVIQGFTDQLAFQVAEAFDQKLQAHVTQSVEPALNALLMEIQGLRQDRQSSDEALMEKLIGQFSGQLQGAAGTELAALGETLKELNLGLQDQVKAAREQHEATQEAAKQSARDLTEQFSKGMEGFRTQVSESVDKLATLRLDADKDAQDQREKLAHLFERGAQSFQSSVTESVDGVTNRIGEALAAISRGQADALADTEKRMAALTETVNQGVGSTVETMTKHMGKLLAQLAEQNRISGLDVTQRIKALGEAFSQAAAALNETLEKSRQMSAEAAQAMERVNSLVEELRAAAKSVEGVADPAERAANRMGETAESMGELARSVREASIALQVSVEALRDAQDQTRATWADYQNRFEGIDAALSGTFDGLNDGLKGYTTQVQDFLKELDRHTAEITGKLGGATEGFTDAVEALSDAVSRMEHV